MGKILLSRCFDLVRQPLQKMQRISMGFGNLFFSDLGDGRGGEHV
jgi:hypothetical protein